MFFKIFKLILYKGVNKNWVEKKEAEKKEIPEIPKIQNNHF